MNLPVETPLLQLLAIPFGMIFGWLLHRGGVTDYNVIVNQFRLKDFTVAKIMLTCHPVFDTRENGCSKNWPAINNGRVGSPLEDLFH